MKMKRKKRLTEKCWALANIHMGRQNYGIPNIKHRSIIFKCTQIFADEKMPK